MTTETFTTAGRRTRINELTESVARRALAVINTPADARILKVVRTGTIVTVATEQPGAYSPYCVDSFRLLAPAEKDPEVWDADEIRDWTLTDQHWGDGPDEVPSMLAKAVSHAASTQGTAAAW
ncbi:hypothetical protein [Streptomyces misionensis]